MSKDKKQAEKDESAFPAKKLMRSTDEKMIAGVCGGISKYLNIDPVLTRVLYIILTLFSGIFLGIIVYIILMIILPEEDSRSQIKPSSANITEEERDE
ncbi:PspC domain-containing protein [candidate division KSB1 bacterium]|nr:PspC domain-containing protein [candidate division KSB1 bacterium]